MSDKRTFILSAHPESRGRAAQAIKEAPDGFAVTIGESTRTLDQNAAQWPILQAFADQLQWPINGRMEWLVKEDWKDILTAAFRQELARVAPGLDGGMVLLGQRTSKFGKKQFSDWLEFLHATAVARDVDLHYLEAA
jgi:NinB protein